ncbi:MAG: site-specific integrase [Clostridiales bacterium]|nr:site-specific integrase [Clostridiales bacterium]
MQQLTDILTRIADRLDEIADKLDGKATSPQSSQTFDEFARYYFDTYRKRKVTPYTFRKDIERYNAHICPTIGESPLHELTPDNVQKLVDSLENRPKTAHEVFTLVNVVCKMAIKHHIITQNPCDVVLLPDYEKQHGKALSRDEERRLLTATAETEYQMVFAVALYTGLRPNEYATARLDGAFITARNSKQKDGKAHFKRIPICPKLAPYLTDTTRLPYIPLKRLRYAFRKVLPSHKLYDLRTTFYTRCQECGVTDLARKLFVGHSLGTLADTYTDVSDDYLIAEAQKIDY